MENSYYQKKILGTGNNSSQYVMSHNVSLNSSRSNLNSSNIRASFRKDSNTNV